MTKRGYNTVAIIALVCGALLAGIGIIKELDVEAIIAIVSIFTCISGTVVGRGE